jgi:hypothetical protein
MGVRRILCGVAALTLVVACGDPASLSSSNESTDQVTDTGQPVGSTDVVPTDAVPTNAVSMNGLEVCTDPPFVNASSVNPAEEELRVVSTLIDAHPELFAGMWWDGASGEYVFATTDPVQATTMVDQDLSVDVAYRLQTVARNASQLAAVQGRASELVGYGLEVSAFSRVWDALVELDLPILDQSTVNAVTEVFAGDLDAICVTGADPATVPPDGPQPTAGDGWRLLADQTHRGDSYSVHVAANEAEYQSLWESLSLDGDRPPVDFANEIVIHFGAVYSGSCPEIRLDGVNFDLDQSLVSAIVVQLGGNRVCTADANARAYLVAVDKARLPSLPFTVSLQSDCSYCAHVEISSLEGSQSPAAALSESDRWQILAAAAVARVGINGTGYETVDIVEVLGRATSDGFVDLDGGTLLTESERNAITQALGSRTVRFVTVSEWENLVPDGDFAVLSFAEPVVTNGQLTITTAMACGSLCGAGGALAVERRDDGTWTTTVPVGPQWEA